MSGIRQAAEGTVNETIALAHVLRSASEGDKVFKYRDLDNREIDIVVINREAKTLRLIEVKSKPEIDTNRVFTNDAKHLFDDAILKNIGVDDSFTVSRILVSKGKSGCVVNQEKSLVLANIEDFLMRYKDLGGFADEK